jgi:hypothetical protein
LLELKHMTMVFDTSFYEFAHGRKPRGYGLWIFAPAGRPGDADAIWIPCATYADAKKQAARIAKARGITRLNVLS